MKRTLERGSERAELDEPDVDGVGAYNARVRALRDAGYRDVVRGESGRSYHASGALASSADAASNMVWHYDEEGGLTACGEERGGRQGPWRFYFPEGELRLLETYGDAVESVYFWRNGNIQARGSSARAGAELSRTGTWLHYWPDGALQQRADYDGDGALIEHFDAAGTAMERGRYRRGAAGFVRDGAFEGPAGVTHWDLGAQIPMGGEHGVVQGQVDLVERLARLPRHQRGPFLQELFHVKPALLTEYFALLCEGHAALPVADGSVIAGVPAQAAAVQVARAAQRVPAARARHFLKVFGGVLGASLGPALCGEWNDGPGRSATLRWLSDHQPEGASEVFVRALGDKSKAVREVAARAIAARADAEGLWFAGLRSPRAAARELAAQGLRAAGSGGQQVRARLAFALQTEPSARVRSTLESALGSLRLLEADLTDEGLDEALAARETAPWSYRTSLRFRTSGRALSPGAHAWVGAALTRESEQLADPELWALRERLHDGDCADLCAELGQPWDPEAPRPARWTLFARALLGDDAQLGALGKSAQDLVYLHSPAFAGCAVAALQRSGKATALRWLAVWSRKAATGKLKRDAAAAMAVAIEELSLDDDDVADLLLPTLGFDARGVRPLGGGYRAVWHSGGLDLDYDGGEVPDKTPAKIERNLEKLRSAVPQAREASFRQLELAMVLGRSWPVPRWTALFGSNPLLVPGLDHVLCQVDGGQPVRATEVVDGARVRVLHRLDVGADACDGSALAPPFAQLLRPVAADPEAELRAWAVQAGAEVAGRIGKVVRFEVDSDGVRVEGADADARMMNEILAVCRSE